MRTWWSGTRGNIAAAELFLFRRHALQRAAAVVSLKCDREHAQEQLLQRAGAEETPQEARGPRFLPGQPHFPVSMAPVYFDKVVVSTCMGTHPC